MNQLERIYVCVDDTDDLSVTTSTGAVAEMIARRLYREFDVMINLGITRHQLWLDDSVPYTSHNSSLCFDLDMEPGCAAQVNEIGWSVIDSMRAEGSEPGLCVLPVPMEDGAPAAGRINELRSSLLSYGLKVKSSYMTVEEALERSSHYPGMILTGGGQMNQGIVGALAGVALRLGGHDGEFRGRFDMTAFSDGDCCSADRCVRMFTRRYRTTPVLADANGAPLEGGDRVRLIRDAKAVLRNDRFTILCSPDSGGVWTPFTKEDLNRHIRRDSCDHFVPDPDEEEHLHDPGNLFCGSCLFRRLTSGGYICSAGYGPVR
ncbi:MAG: hypothetical protein II787_03335 [Lachnospiraceae bacterium]|nr:hypothetical protein [Lachnospiraceae bacterium]